jgi:hypothetical protein
MDIFNSVFRLNSAWRGAAIELRDGSFMRARKLTFDRNQAFYSAGAIYLSSFSSMNVLESSFTLNKAPLNSAIEVLQGARDRNITIDDCLFEKNAAIRNTISLRDANVAINNS